MATEAMAEIEIMEAEKSGKLNRINEVVSSVVCKDREKKEISATFLLGCMYYKKDIFFGNETERAMELIHEAARDGHIGAQVLLGYIYCKGDGVERDDEKSVYWMKIVEKRLAEGVSKGPLLYVLELIDYDTEL